jgi:hypothetical protein
MFTPKFPYSGNQLILSSDRVTLHSKNDAIFLFGKEAVSLSSVKTINLDANEKVLIDCRKIELGNRAETLGQPVVLGETLNTQLIVLLRELQTAGALLKQASESELGTSMQAISSAGQKIYRSSENMLRILNKKLILSKNTYTR